MNDELSKAWRMRMRRAAVRIDGEPRHRRRPNVAQRREGRLGWVIGRHHRKRAQRPHSLHAAHAAPGCVASCRHRHRIVCGTASCDRGGARCLRSGARSSAAASRVVWEAARRLGFRTAAAGCGPWIGAPAAVCGRCRRLRGTWADSLRRGPHCARSGWLCPDKQPHLAPARLSGGFDRSLWRAKLDGRRSQRGAEATR